jgi:hypothetical protein
LQLEEAHVAEFNQFNKFWDEKMQEFNEQVQSVVDQLVAKHQEDLPKFLEDLDNQIPVKPKESAQLLNLRKIQENLARQKEYAIFINLNFSYIEAHKVQMKCAQLVDLFSFHKILRKKTRMKNMHRVVRIKSINSGSSLKTNKKMS